MPLSEQFRAGRAVLSLPQGARLTGFAAVVDGLDLLELDLGDVTEEALELAWEQVTEQTRAGAGYAETRLDELAWAAEFKTADGRNLVALHRDASMGLVARASLVAMPDAPHRWERLRKLYRRGGTEFARAAGFALKHGFLDTPPESAEEVAASFSLPTGAEISISTCMVAAVTEPDFAGLRDTMTRSPMGAALGSEALVAEQRAVGGLLGEELRFYAVGDAGVRLHAVWRCSGAAHDLLRPEIEVEYSGSVNEREEQSDLEWASIIQSLALSGGWS